MKVIKYYAPGRIPSKKNSRITNRKTGRSFPSKKYTEWHKECTEFIKEEFGLPPEPIQHCHKIVLDIYYPDKRIADNTNKAESVHDLLVDLGIFKDDSWLVTGPTTQVPHFDKGMPRWIITIFSDEKHPYHEGMDFDKWFNVVGENEITPNWSGFRRNYKTVVKNRKKRNLD